MMNEKQQAILANVARHYYGENAQFDPSFLIWLFEFFKNEILPLIEQCAGDDTEHAVRLVNNPNLWSRLALRGALIRSLGFREFRRAGGRVLVSAMLKAGEELHHDEYVALVE